MSIPITCQDAGTQCQDTLMHVLYSGGAEGLIRSLIAQSLRNIAEDYQAYPGVLAPLRLFQPPPVASLAFLRVVFLILLNQDSRMRATLCDTRFLPSLPPMCPHKACRLYDQLRLELVAWIKNESVDLLQLEESLKEAYLVS
jgi:hypothetical protein